MDQLELGDLRAKYTKLLHEVSQFIGVSAFGVEKAAKSYEYAESVLGDGTKEFSKGFRDSQYHIAWKLLLVYSVVLMEEMIWDYSVSLAGCKSVPESPSGQVQNASSREFHHWRETIRSIAKQSLRDSGLESSADRVADLIAEDNNWLLLFKAKIIRNLEIHNRGLMNERNFSRYPLSEIGSRPNWDRSLVYDLIAALNLLNDRLSGYGVSDSNSEST